MRIGLVLTALQRVSGVTEIGRHPGHQKTADLSRCQNLVWGLDSHPVGVEGVVMVSEGAREEEFESGTLFFMGGGSASNGWNSWNGGQGGPGSKEVGGGVASSSPGKGGGSSSGLM